MENEELIEIVGRIQTADFALMEEGGELRRPLEKNVAHPEVSDLILRNEAELSAAEIIERALNYKPIPLPEKFD